MSTEHARCPMCGGTARLEWTSTNSGLLALVPCCATCGTEASVAYPLPVAVQTEPGWPEGVNPDNLLQAIGYTWESWDNAWWTKQEPDGPCSECSDRLDDLADTERRLHLAEIKASGCPCKCVWCEGGR